MASQADDDNTIERALVRALSSDSIKDMFRNDILKPIADKVDLRKKKIDILVNENDMLRSELEELKQYTRRNALRIYNSTWREIPDECTDDLILNLSDEFGLSIKRDEISRSHRVGKPQPRKLRPVLVKFISFRARQKLFNARKDISMAYPFIHINEDLTRLSSDLAFKAREFRRQGRLYQTWVYDGTIFIRTYEGSRAHVVRDEDDLSQQLAPTLNQLFSEVATQGPRHERPGYDRQSPTMSHRASAITEGNSRTQGVASAMPQSSSTNPNLHRPQCNASPARYSTPRNLYNYSTALYNAPASRYNTPVNRSGTPMETYAGPKPSPRPPTAPMVAFQSPNAIAQPRQLGPHGHTN